MINNQHLQCIKSLYKSTYKKNAFTKNKKYQIEFEEIWNFKYLNVSQTKITNYQNELLI